MVGVVKRQEDSYGAAHREGSCCVELISLRYLAFCALFYFSEWTDMTEGNVTGNMINV